MSTITRVGPIGTFLIVPLTTIWTPPCGPFVTFVNLNLPEATTCVPPQYESVWYSYGYYSPAICPSGYSSGCTPNNLVNYGGTLKAGETAAICVPK